MSFLKRVVNGQAASRINALYNCSLAGLGSTKSDAVEVEHRISLQWHQQRKGGLQRTQYRPDGRSKTFSTDEKPESVRLRAKLITAIAYSPHSSRLQYPAVLESAYLRPALGDQGSSPVHSSPLLSTPKRDLSPRRWICH